MSEDENKHLVQFFNAHFEALRDDFHNFKEEIQKITTSLTITVKEHSEIATLNRIEVARLEERFKIYNENTTRELSKLQSDTTNAHKRLDGVSKDLYLNIGKVVVLGSLALGILWIVIKGQQ